MWKVSIVLFSRSAKDLPPEVMAGFQTPGKIGLNHMKWAIKDHHIFRSSVTIQVLFLSTAGPYSFRTKRKQCSFVVFGIYLF